MSNKPKKAWVAQARKSETSVIKKHGAPKAAKPPIRLRQRLADY